MFLWSGLVLSKEDGLACLSHFQCVSPVWSRNPAPELSQLFVAQSPAGTT